MHKLLWRILFHVQVFGISLHIFVLYFILYFVSFILFSTYFCLVVVDGIIQIFYVLSIIPLVLYIFSIYFEFLLLHGYTFRIVISSWWIHHLGNIKYLCLSINMTFLEIYSVNINTAILAALHLVFVYYIFSLLFTCTLIFIFKICLLSSI